MSNTIPGLVGGILGGSGGIGSDYVAGSQLAGGSGGSGGLIGSRSIGSLQAASSVLAGLGEMGADQSRAASYRIQGSEWGSQATSDYVQGANEVGGLKAQYLAAIGQSTARTGASGVDVGQGVGQQTRTTIGQNAANAMQVTELAADVRRRRDLVNAIQANEAADQADILADCVGDAAHDLVAYGLSVDHIGDRSWRDAEFGRDLCLIAAFFLEGKLSFQ